MTMVWRIFSGDVRNLFRNVIAAIVVMGLVLVPPLYAWFTTLGFWDPYSNTGNIKVAVASQDEGYQSDLIPTKINAGENVISALRANDQFDWQFVSEEQALDGVESGEYYAALVIPKSFSADLMTVFSGDATDSKIIYYSNEKENAIAQRVTSTGASTLQETIDETFTQTVASVALDTTSGLTNFLSGEGILAYAQTLESRLEAATGEMSAAADQAGAYADLMGTTGSLVEATAAILDQAGTAPDSAAPLIADAQNSLSSARTGLDGAADAADEALSQASASVDAVEGALTQAFDAMKDDPSAAQEVLRQSQADVEALASAYHAMAQSLATAAPGSQAASAAAQAAADLDALAASLGAAQSSISTDAGAIDQARQSATDALNRARSSLDGSEETYRTQLESQMDSLSSALDSVGADVEGVAGSLKGTADSLGGATDSLGQSIEGAEGSLRAASDTLSTAASQLSQAQQDLANALATGDIQEIRRIIGDNPTAVAKFLAAPTHLERHAVYAMDDNGSAMSPFYTSLCLWIGAIFMVALMSVAVSPKRQAALEAAVGRKPTNAELYLGRYGIFALIGLAQALIVGLGNVFFLGVECQHFWLYLLACCVASIVFTNLIYTLTVSFGNIGKALAIIGLVVQLGGAGGLMPVQMSAPFFQAVYPWLPFAHSMEALQGAMAGIYGTHYWMSLGALLLFLAASLALGLVLRRPVIKLNDWVLAKLDETKFL